MSWVVRALVVLRRWHAALRSADSPAPKYDAFISYSHAKDRLIAKALQSAIQRLGKPWYKLRAMRVFRDDASLAANPNLWGSIELALKSSSHLILIASKNSAVSAWVGNEVAYWIEHKGTDTLLIGLTEALNDDRPAPLDEGNSVGASPDAAVSAGSQMAPAPWTATVPLPALLAERLTNEPRWVDLRRFRAGADTGSREFMSLAADFAAAIRRMPKEDLLSEEVRQQRIALTLALAAAVALFVIAVVAITERNRAENTLAAATRSANKLTLDVAAKLRETIGIPIDVVRSVLGHVKDLQAELIRYNEADPDLRRSRAIALRETSQTLLVQGDRDAALVEAQRSREIMDALLREQPGDADIKRELSLTLNRIGDALSAAGRHQEALDRFRDSLAIRQELALRTAGIEPQRNLALSHERVGDEFYILGKRDDALEEYRACQAIRERLARDNPDRPQQQADLAVSYDRLARMQASGDAALEIYRRSLAIRRKLVQDEPRNADWKRALAVTHDDIGNILLASGRRDEAIASYLESLKVREALADANPEIAQWKALRAVSLYFLADAGDRPKERYALALQILRRLALDGRLPANLRGLTEEIEMRLDRLPG
jgi:tetratricopeptide (TPR) repeat protein